MFDEPKFAGSCWDRDLQKWSRLPSKLYRKLKSKMKNSVSFTSLYPPRCELDLKNFINVCYVACLVPFRFVFDHEKVEYKLEESRLRKVHGPSLKFLVIYKRNRKNL